MPRAEDHHEPEVVVKGINTAPGRISKVGGTDIGGIGVGETGTARVSQCGQNQHASWGGERGAMVQGRRGGGGRGSRRK